MSMHLALRKTTRHAIRSLEIPLPGSNQTVEHTCACIDGSKKPGSGSPRSQSASYRNIYLILPGMCASAYFVCSLYETERLVTTRFCHNSSRGIDRYCFPCPLQAPARSCYTVGKCTQFSLSARLPLRRIASSENGTCIVLGVGNRITRALRPAAIDIF